MKQLPPNEKVYGALWPPLSTFPIEGIECIPSEDQGDVRAIGQSPRYMWSDLDQSLAIEGREAYTWASREWMRVGFDQRGVSPVCTEDHVLEHVLFQL